jgi:patatin-like phospholipase/acyl hydrolase
MTAGTSTGSIIAAGLGCPSKNDRKIPAYFANDLLDIYVNKNKEIFKYNGYSVAAKIFIVFFTTVVFGSSGYFCGYLKYN